MSAPWRGPVDQKYKYSNIFSLKALFKNFDTSIAQGETKEFALWLNDRQPILESDLIHEDQFIRVFANKYYNPTEAAVITGIRVPGSWAYFLEGGAPVDPEPVKKPRKKRTKKEQL